jgi:hypothetical protein
LQALDHKNESALKLFSDVIMAADVSKINEVDVANSMSAFAHFNYVNFDSIEKLLKQTIKQA